VPTTTTVPERRAAARLSARAVTSAGAPVAAQAIERLEIVVPPVVVTGLLSPFIVVEILVRTLIDAGRAVLLPSALLAGSLAIAMSRGRMRGAVARRIRSVFGRRRQ
jgi:hypothetical protein